MTCPAHDLFFFSQPTSSTPWGCELTIWDPGGPHQTPLTAIRIPKMTQFTLSTLIVGKGPLSHPNIANDTIFFQPTSSTPWGCRLTIWDP